MVVSQGQDRGSLQTPWWPWGDAGPLLLELGSAAGPEEMPWVELRFPPCRYLFLMIITILVVS